MKVMFSVPSGGVGGSSRFVVLVVVEFHRGMRYSKVSLQEGGPRGDILRSAAPEPLTAGDRAFSPLEGWKGIVGPLFTPQVKRLNLDSSA